MTAPTQQKSFSEIGVSGLTHYNGLVDEEFLKPLQGDKGIKAYKEMWLNSSIVGAIVRSIAMLTRQVEWKFETKEPVNEDGTMDPEKTKMVELRDFVTEAWHDTSTDPRDFLAEATQGVVVFGFQFDEIVYKTRQGIVPGSPGQSSVFTDGKIGWRKFASRSQDTRLRWVLDTQGGVRAFVQLAPPRFQAVEIPIEKGLLFRHEMYKNNPEGQSMLRNAYRDWYFVKKIEEIEGIGIERDMNGLPVLTHPAELSHPDATAEHKAIYAQAQKLVRNIKKDEQMGVTLPMEFDQDGNPMWKLELLSTAGRRSIDTNAVLQRYYAHIAMTLLADWLVMGHEKVGSFALASSKTELFAVALGSLLDSIAGVINRHAIPRLLRLNGMDEALAPRLVHGDIETQNAAELASAIQTLANAGMPLFPDPTLEAHIREQVGLPEVDPEAREALIAEREQAKAQEANMMAERLKAASQGNDNGRPREG